jgi:HEAT repeat protein
MKPNQNTRDDNELDLLLRTAQWPPFRAEQLARLTSQWRSARRRRARVVYARCAIAAGLLLTLGTFVLHYRRTDSSATRIDSALTETRHLLSSERPSPAIDHSPATLDISGSSREDDQIVARDANVYERVMMNARVRDGSRAGAVSRPKSLESKVEELVADLAGDVKADVTQRLPVGERDIMRCERILWDIVADSTGDRHVGAARLLARVATPRSIPTLFNLVNDPATHDVALFALGRLATTPELARLATVERDATVRLDLFKMLLERRTTESVGLYLVCVGNQDSRSFALTAIADMADAPTDLLVVFLQSPQKSLRLAAAQALSQLSTPEVAGRLSELATDGPSRQEALIALLLSHSAEANFFLNRARQNLYLMASVHAAEQELQTLAVSNGGNLR